MRTVRLRVITGTGITAVLNANHYGYYSDLISGVINTALSSFSLRSPDAQNEKNTYSSPIVSKFIKDGQFTNPTTTKSLNIDSSNRIFGAYFDGEIPASAIDREEYINELDVLTTI
jgi:hypothetical protein